MSYITHHLSTAVRNARIAWGLSQRELSTRSGIPQAQISKFENGVVDLRLSSLVALCRALGLELEPVPKKTLPAIHSIVRNTMLQATVNSELFARAKVALERVLQEISKFNPRSREIERLQEHMNFLDKAGIPTAQSKNFMSWIKFLERLQETPLDIKNIANLMRRTEKLRKQIEQIPVMSNESLPPRPAYSLQEESDA